MTPKPALDEFGCPMVYVHKRQRRSVTEDVESSFEQLAVFRHRETSDVGDVHTKRMREPSISRKQQCHLDTQGSCRSQNLTRA